MWLLVFHEKNWSERCPREYRPSYYQRYVDDIDVLFNSPEHLKPFLSYLHSRHVNIFFAIEDEKENRIAFLDVNVV